MNIIGRTFFQPSHFRPSTVSAARYWSFLKIACISALLLLCCHFWHDIAMSLAPSTVTLWPPLVALVPRVVPDQLHLWPGTHFPWIQRNESYIPRPSTHSNSVDLHWNAMHVQQKTRQCCSCPAHQGMKPKGDETEWEMNIFCWYLGKSQFN